MRLKIRRWFRQPRSAGVTVTPSTLNAIDRGNRERAAGRWANAANAYRDALRQHPGLYHIEVQLGHALKEHGDIAGAEAVYRSAIEGRPCDRDAILHLAHLLKVGGVFEEAAACYVQLALADPEDEEAMREARDTLARIDGEGWRALAEDMARRLSSQTTSDDRRFPPIETCELVFDVSDLLHYYSLARRPTGIQRVQTETVVRAIEAAAAGGPPAAACSFIAGRDEWVEVPAASFLALARLSVAGGDGDERLWSLERDRFLLALLVGRGFEFRRRAILVNLGTSWWLQNYFLRVRDAQAHSDITYVPMVYDMIPVLFPAFCIDSLVQDFIAWTLSIFEHTRTFLAISEASKRDLIATAARLGHVVAPDLVSVVPLSADFASSDAMDADGAVPVALCGKPFILLVSTIEPRKGHLAAFDAWARLIERLGIDRVPQLVCVGRNGWRNAAVYARLEQDQALARRVTILSSLSDADLGALYRNSLFTIYPSLYEGWGLPVTEALCRGKVVVTTTSSSLPEAGGKFASFVPPGDAEALAREVERLIVDPAARVAAEHRIAAGFQPRSWNEIARQIGDDSRRLAAVDRAEHAGVQGPPVARLGVFYWLGRSYGMEVLAQADMGEAFRAGLKWREPEEWGCRTKPEGGALALTLPAEAASSEIRLAVTLRLAGSGRARCAFRISGGACPLASGVLGQRERRNVTIEVIAPSDGVLYLELAGTTADVVDPLAPVGENNPADTVGLEGFVLTVANC